MEEIPLITRIQLVSLTRQHSELTMIPFGLSKQARGEFPVEVPRVTDPTKGFVLNVFPNIITI